MEAVVPRDWRGLPRVRPVIETGKVGAKQSFKDEVDINNILAQYVRTGLLTPVQSRPPIFVDVTEVGDYRTALEHVSLAQEMFMELGSEIRAEFDNDPALFLDFCTEEGNEGRMRELGLLPELPLEAAPAAEPAPPEPVDPPSGD